MKTKTLIFAALLLIMSCKKYSITNGPVDPTFRIEMTGNLDKLQFMLHDTVDRGYGYNGIATNHCFDYISIPTKGMMGSPKLPFEYKGYSIGYKALKFYCNDRSDPKTTCNYTDTSYVIVKIYVREQLTITDTVSKHKYEFNTAYPEYNFAIYK